MFRKVFDAAQLRGDVIVFGVWMHKGNKAIPEEALRKGLACIFQL